MLTASWMVNGNELQPEFNPGFGGFSLNLGYDLSVQPLDAPYCIAAGSVRRYYFSDLVAQNVIQRGE